MKSVNHRKHHNRPSSRKLPTHAKLRVGRLPIMASPNHSGCPHALSRHEDIASDGKTITISFALPCTAKHKATSKTKVHHDSLGRKWT